MDRAKLEEVLSKVTDRASEDYQTAFEKAQRASPDSRDLLLHYDLAGPVEEVLASQPEFADGGGFMIQRPNGYSGFNRREVSQRLVRRALDRGPESALDWLEKVVSTTEAECLCIMALWGIKTDDSVDFDEHVALLPVEELPESKEKEVICQRTYMGFPTTPQQLYDPPQAALMTTKAVKPFCWDLRNGDTPKQETPLAEYEKLQDVSLALTLASDTPHLQAGYWTQFVDSDFNEATFGSGIATQNMEVYPQMLLTKEPINPGAAQDAVNGFLTLDERSQQKVKMTLERLNLAMRRLRLGDKAVDLSIAFEGILKRKERVNRYTLALRAALLLGGDLDQRTENRAILETVYTLRNEQVHQGSLSRTEINVKGLGTRPLDQLLKSGVRLCKRITLEILKRGSIPDWRTLELRPKE